MGQDHGHGEYSQTHWEDRMEKHQNPDGEQIHQGQEEQLGQKEVEAGHQEEWVQGHDMEDMEE